MIQFEEDGKQYHFDPEEKETDYRGDNDVLIKTLSSIESLASVRVEADKEPLDGTSSEMEYRPNMAENVLERTIEKIDGVQIVNNGPQVIDRGHIVIHDGVIHKRVYVDDPSEVPPGVTLHEGDRGGLYYDDDSTEFMQGQLEADADRMEEYDFSDEQIQEGVETLSRINQKANDIFGEWFEVGRQAGELTGAAHRTKALGSALEKVHDRKDENYDAVADLDDAHGSMLKYDSIEECTNAFEGIQDLIEQEEGMELVEADDKYGDDESPYRAQHIIAEVDGDNVELQIKQEDMSDIASASHKLTFKPETAPVDEMDTLDEPASEPMQEEINECLIEMADYVEGTNDDVACSEESMDIIQEFFEITGT